MDSIFFAIIEIFLMRYYPSLFAIEIFLMRYYRSLFAIIFLRFSIFSIIF